MLGARFSREVVGLGLAVGLAFAVVEPVGHVISTMMNDGPWSWAAGSGAAAPHHPAATYNLNRVPYGIDRGLCDRTAVGRDLKAGVIAPASLLVGSGIGARMDETDQECVSNVLEYAPDQQRVLWRNSNNGLTYSVIAMQTYQTDRGIYCRDYGASAAVNGQRQEIRQSACRQPSGTWSVMRGTGERR